MIFSLENDFSSQILSSLYIHVPFCRKKCDYCDFYSIPEVSRKDNGVSKSNDLTDDYISALLNEISFYADFYKISAWKTIYVGGGTPSLLSASQIKNLFNGIKSKTPFAENIEITVEMNPDDVREDFIKACEEVGVNRLSLGIQALDDKALDFVHRGCSCSSALEALHYLNTNWNGRLSVDFIAGLPRQTYKSFKSQFETVFSFKKIDHISLYTLTIEESTPLGRKINAGEFDFSFDRADKMWLTGRNILERNGFSHYEISNFAKEGFESKHNSTYWKLENYIGCGAGASGTWYEKNTAIRWTDTLSIPVYIKFWNNTNNENLKIDLIPRQIENLDKKTLEFEYLMMGFRMRCGISSNTFSERFGYSLLEYKNTDGKMFADIFFEWKKQRLASSIKKNGDEIFFLNKRGILLLNRFLEELL